MFKLIKGDCLNVMREMTENSIDSIVTDPPYGLKFMGKRWDCSVPSVDVWRECLRVLKPGGHMLVFAGTRTQHRMATAIESAGFEIRDMIAWVYGSGFPKSKNLGDGIGSALKPAMEPITVARKPFTGSLQNNHSEWGTGGLNIDGCRVEPTGESRERTNEASQGSRYTDRGATDFAATPGIRGGHPIGRWPANLIHDGSDEVRAAFPDAKGQQGTITGDEPSGVMGHANTYGKMDRRHVAIPRVETDKCAARFFYCAKASKKERGEDNHHPTVKPVEISRYLCRLVTPTGGVILDPYMGSGSVGCAALAEDFHYIGIELDEDENGEPLGYMSIAEARISAEWDKQLLELGLL